VLKKKIFNLGEKEITLERVLAVARKHEMGERSSKQKETISNVFKKKEQKSGPATPSQPIQPPP
jgi:hypothetical protein